MQQRSAELETLANPRTWLLAIGFGLLLCHSATYNLTALRLPALDVPGVPPKYFTIASLLIEVATFIALALLSLRRSKPLRDRRGILVVAVVACCAFGVAQCDVLIGGAWEAPLISGIVRCVVRGVFPAILWIAWAETLACFDSRHVLTSYIVASLFAAGLTLFASNLPALALACVSYLSLVISVALMVVIGRGLENKEGACESAEAGAWTFPAVPVLLMAVFAFANVFARNLLQLENRGIADIGVVVVMALLLVMLAVRKTRFRVWSLYAMAFPLTLFGLFALGDPTGSLGTLSIICIHAGDGLFAVFIGVVLCNISYRWGVSAAMLFGCAKAASALASLCGGFVASYARVLDGGTLTLLLGLVGTGFAACYVVFTKTPSSEATWGIAVADVEAANAIEEKPGEEESVWSACAHLAYRYGLTRREEQVLALVARGYTASQIEEELSITNSTVKTHTNAVFRKLGVHSRKEIVDMVAEMG